MRVCSYYSLLVTLSTIHYSVALSPRIQCENAPTSSGVRARFDSCAM